MKISLAACLKIWVRTRHFSFNDNIVKVFIAILVGVFDLSGRFAEAPALIGGSSALPLTLPSLQTAGQGDPHR